eukprot:1976649-Pleurochrysis_carterae.AAC.5
MVTALASTPLIAPKARPSSHRQVDYDGNSQVMLVASVGILTLSDASTSSSLSTSVRSISCDHPDEAV